MIIMGLMGDLGLIGYMKNFVKFVISFVLVVFYFFLPQFVFPDGGIIGHALYPLSHANIFHLLANILCLWMISCELHFTTSFLLAALCSFLPCFVSEPTMGFSGVLFSVIGISWGNAHRFKDMIWRNKWFLVVPVFIPHVNAFIHIYCLLAGYVVGRIGLIGKIGIDRRFGDLV